MTSVTVDWGIVIQLFALIASGIGVYAAIRADLALIHERQGVMKENINEVKNNLTAHISNSHCHRRESDL